MTDAGRHVSARLPAGVYLAGALLVVLLMIFAGRYGFHRDEYYFIEGGHHLAWAQPDNPELIPLLAAGWHWLVGGNLWGFRILPALAVGVFSVIGGLSARELGGEPKHQVAAAIATALTGIASGTGHLFSTTTFDMTVTAAAVWLLIRAVRDGRWVSWLALGITAGIASEIKIIIFAVIGTALLGLLIMGPRQVFRGPKLWVAALITVVLAAPNLIWQSVHGWPQRQIADNIAAGGSTSSSSRLGLLPNILLTTGPVICVVMIIGVVWLLRGTRRREVGWLSVGFLLLVILDVIGGGKAYYPAGYLPAMMAAGAIPLLDWTLRRTWRRVLVITLAALSAVATTLLTMPVAPIGSTLFKVGVAVNPDSAETVGWNGYIHTIADVASGLPAAERARTVIITGNYGEAGALARARRMHTPDGLRLPPVYSGHNAFWYWGPPPSDATNVILVGYFEPSQPTSWFDRCRQVTTLVSPAGVDNQEAGAPVRICSGPRQPWPRLWPRMAELG
ncbi:glycosyltransferase family 39 protein [Microlunatus elymi]|uniref:Glycosyltransferase family 39 protein n=1 Tax=Microlunatus elymi TaxID=2596828 RepID=A0A516Q266_9ACTN|nr:glycosyltransferase family 39 protein [Microlunatus elymi]QDP97523.1 glycosyltransferase family 39 protein [Microlunatus elymi]